jgi:hypothetical protein
MPQRDVAPDLQCGDGGRHRQPGPVCRTDARRQTPEEGGDRCPCFSDDVGCAGSNGPGLDQVVGPRAAGQLPVRVMRVGFGLPYAALYGWVDTRPELLIYYDQRSADAGCWPLPHRRGVPRHIPGYPPLSGARSAGCRRDG